MSASTISVRLHKVSVAFHGREVVREVSADFPLTGLSVVVGRSGSGKTSLLRSVNRLNEEFPGCTTSGRVELNLGQGLETVFAAPANGRAGPGSGPALSYLRRRVGMVFQSPNVFPASILKNIALPLEYVAECPKKDLAQRARAALEAVGLWDEVADRLDTPADRLSGGQQQRLCLARTLALDPAILLLDEPTASLDVRAARDVEALLLQLAKCYPVIMVSHSLPQACRLGRDVLVLREGCMVRRFTAGEDLTEENLAALLEEEL